MEKNICAKYYQKYFAHTEPYAVFVSWFDWHEKEIKKSDYNIGNANANKVGEFCPENHSRNANHSDIQLIAASSNTRRIFS